LFNAFVDGVGRVQRAPALIAGLWLTTFLLAWPLAVTLRGMLADHLGASLAAESAARAANYDWWNEFLAQAAGIGHTFVPAILGFAAVLKNISGLADASGLSTVIASAVTAHIVVSIFLLGGTLDRLARDRRTTAHQFFAACGAFFFRLLRLGVIAAAFYWTLFTTVHGWLFERVYAEAIRAVAVEQTAFLYRVALYLVFGLVVVALNIWFDYAKIRMVVEDRRSALGALISSLRFIRRNAGSVAGLYAVNLALFLLLLAVYALVAPGASGGIALWVGLLIGQLYITLRVILRLLFAASQIALFQSRLAHAGYAARPLPVWPDSAAADAIRPA
jgi:hypothetical protein